MERAFAKMKTKAKWAGAFFVVSLGWLHVAFAQQTGGSNTHITLTDPLGGQSFTQVVANVIGFIFWDVAIPLCTIMALVGAFQMMTSGGNPEKASQGRKTLMYAAIGFAVALIASGITGIIQSILNNQ